MTPLQLANGGVALVDDADLPLVSGRVWRANYRYVNGQRAGVIAVVSGTVKLGTFVALHRLLTACPPGMVVDHVDGDPRNNCRANLRLCSQAENLRNRKRAKSNRSGFKGVYRDSSSSSFRAEIKIDGKRFRLGSFPTAEQAHAAYVAASHQHHGAFARAA